CIKWKWCRPSAERSAHMVLGVWRQFCIVRDIKINHYGNREKKPPAKSSFFAVPAKEAQTLKASEKSPTEDSKDLKSSSSRYKWSRKRRHVRW
ncbi:hypothetical protein Tco_0187469, partial [Tanacetum coccineum]